MKRFLLVALVSAVLAIVGEAGELPPTWSLRGLNAKDYDAGVDRAVLHREKPSVYLKSTTAKTAGTGIIWQEFDARVWAGKRIRITLPVRGKDVADFVGLPVRITRTQGRPVNFRPDPDPTLSGTFDWSRWETVIDIPADATDLAAGFGLRKTGQIWVGEATIESVPRDVPVTMISMEQVRPLEPLNLDFEK